VARGTFRDWLRRKMAQAQLNQSQLALELDLSASVVNRWASGAAKPNAASSKLLADFFDVPLEEVYGLVGIPFREEAPPRPRSFEEKFELLYRDRPIAIPIHDQLASAGTGQQVLEYAYWEAPRAAGRNIVGLRVRGDSMEPEILDGDTVFIDRDMPAEPGRTVVASIGDEVVIKKLRRKGGRLVLAGRSGDVPADDAKIEGVVIQLSREVP
jgi:repressor LexA